MEKGLVSIIVPVYNAEKYLEYCVESLLNQIYTPCEIILIDDGSADSSGLICDRYAKQNENVKVFHGQNEGVSAARNRGLAMAEGEFICFVDGDDWISANMIAYLQHELDDEEINMAMCRIKIVHEREAEEKTEYSAIKKVVQNWEEYLKENFLKHGNSCCAKLFRKRDLEGLYFKKNLTIGEDMLFLLNALEKFQKVAVLDFDGYYYMQVPSSAMNDTFKASYMDQIYCWQEAYEAAAIYGRDIQDRISAIIIISSLLVLNKIALLKRKQRPGESCRICKKAVRDNGRGVNYLTRKQKIQYCLCRISYRLYIWCYCMTKKGA